jgi:hypothetical protein
MSVILVLAALSAATALFVANLYVANRKVEQYLIDRGASDIDVRPELFDLDRDTLTFTVRYTGVSGERHTTQCKLRHLFFIHDDVIFWRDPLELDLHHTEQVDTSWRSGQPTPLRWRGGRDGEDQ